MIYKSVPVLPGFHHVSFAFCPVVYFHRVFFWNQARSHRSETASWLGFGSGVPDFSTNCIGVWMVSIWIYLGSHGGTPIAGCFISWKIPSRNGWWLGVALWLRNPQFLDRVFTSLKTSGSALPRVLGLPLAQVFWGESKGNKLMRSIFGCHGLNGLKSLFGSPWWASNDAKHALGEISGPRHATGWRRQHLLLPSQGPGKPCRA